MSMLLFLYAKSPAALLQTSLARSFCTFQYRLGVFLSLFTHSGIKHGAQVSHSFVASSRLARFSFLCSTRVIQLRAAGELPRRLRKNEPEIYGSCGVSYIPEPCLLKVLSFRTTIFTYLFDNGCIKLVCCQLFPGKKGQSGKHASDFSISNEYGQSEVLLRIWPVSTETEQ